MSKSKINDSGDDATLSSMVEESETELDKMGPSDRSKSRKWQASAKLVRSIRKFHYLQEDPKDEVSGKTLVIKSRSTRADKSKDTVEDLDLVSAETENVEEDDPLPPLAFKFRMIASLIDTFRPYIFKSDGGYEKWLSDLIDLKAKASLTPVDGIFTSDVVIDKACDVWARIFAFSETTDKTTGKDIQYPVVVYFHGGGFVLFDPKSSDYDKLCRKLAKATNAIIISVNYRITPYHKFPTQYEDSYKALQWLKATKPGSDSLPASADLSRCFLAGDSAGGNITHTVGCRAVVDDLGPIKIRGLILFQPFFGGEKRTTSELSVKHAFLLTDAMADWFWKSFLPDGANRDHESANVLGPNAPDISKLPLPPIFIALGTHDILKDRQVQYAKYLATVIGKNNITVKKYSQGFHGFFAFDLVLQKALMADVSAFVKEALAKIPQS